jgi:hypothetical protein
VLATETFARETATTRDSANLRIKGAEDQAALADWEALEQVSRVEVANSTALSYPYAR